MSQVYSYPKKGSRIRLLATGLGAADSSGHFAVTATVSGIGAAVNSVAQAADSPQGYLAVEISVPAGAPEGDFIEVRIQIASLSSQPGVTVALR